MVRKPKKTQQQEIPAGREAEAAMEISMAEALQGKEAGDKVRAKLAAFTEADWHAWEQVRAKRQAEAEKNQRHEIHGQYRVTLRIVTNVTRDDRKEKVKEISQAVKEFLGDGEDALFHVMNILKIETLWEERKADLCEDKE